MPQPQSSAPAAPIRRAVVLAAGYGSRMTTHGVEQPPKPLRQVGGRTLLDRTVSTLASAGVDEVVVVVGHRAAELETAVAALQVPGVKVRCVLNPRFDRSNGLSVAVVRGQLEAPFLLSMADHVYDPELPALAARADMKAADLWLCVDRRVDEVFDIDDATKVATRDDKIVAIAKDLATYDCIDTGVFAVGQPLLDVLDELFGRSGDCSLSDGVRVLAARGRARVLDIGAAFWQDVDTPEARQIAETALARRAAGPAV